MRAADSRGRRMVAKPKPITTVKSTEAEDMEAKATAAKGSKRPVEPVGAKADKQQDTQAAGAAANDTEMVPAKKPRKISAGTVNQRTHDTTAAVNGKSAASRVGSNNKEGDKCGVYGAEPGNATDDKEQHDGDKVGSKPKAKEKAKRGVKRAAASADAKSFEVDDADGSGDDGAGARDDEQCGGAAGRRGAGLARKAAQRVKSYKEDGGGKEEEDEDEEEGETMKVKIATAKSEEEVVRQTDRAIAGQPSCSSGIATRSLVDYFLSDSEGRLEPLNRLGNVDGGLFFSGCVYPAGHPTGPTGTGRSSSGCGGAAMDVRQQARMASKLGPIASWHVQYSANTAPKLVFRTALAQYECGKPTEAYGKVLAPLLAQVELAGVVHRALCPEAGGRLDEEYDNVCCKVARCKVSQQYGGAGYALKLNGGFIFEQLKAMAGASGVPNGAVAAATSVGAADKGKGPADKGKGAVACTYDNGPFAAGLEKAMATEDHIPISRQTLMMLEGGRGVAAAGIRIASDGGAADEDAAGGSRDAEADAMDEDYQLACRLMAEEYAEHMRGDTRSAGGRQRGGAGGGSKEAYIQVRPEEIADDYPAPKEYKGVEGQEEWDELILEDPETLGSGFQGADDREDCRTLDNFAIYNAEGFMTTLELVPMVAGLDVDLNIFASGVIEEGTDDFWGQMQQLQGQNADGAGGSGNGGNSGGAGGSSSGAGSNGGGGSGGGAEGAKGQRFFLTQIREWCVECGPGGLLAINIRTDVSWYRLLRPLDSYVRWHRVVSRCAHLGVQLLTRLAEQERAAKLSFTGAVAALAGLGSDHPAYVGNKADAVERFIVVHGQVILDMIKRHYKPAVRQCGFGKELRTKLLQRQHFKIKSRGKKGKGNMGGVKPVVENPVKARQERKSGRPVAMHATSTAQVHRIWSEYFATSAAQQQQQEDGEVPQPQQQHHGAYGGAPVAGAVALPAGGSGGSRGAGGSKGSGGAGGSGGSVAIAEARAGVRRSAEVEPKTWTLEDKNATDSASGRTLYSSATCGDVRLTPGSVIRLGPSEADKKGNTSRGDGKDSSESSGEDNDNEKAEQQQDEDSAAAAAAERLDEMTRGSFGMVQCIFTNTTNGREGSPQLQIRLMVHGRDTLLGDVAAPDELFLLDPTPRPVVPSSRGGGSAALPPAAQGLLRVLPLNGRTVAELVEVQALNHRPCGHLSRLENAKTDLDRRLRNLERAASGLPPLLVYRSTYCPQHGMFREVRSRELALGTYVQVPSALPSLALLPGGGGFCKDGVTYRVGDFLYVRAGALGGEEKVQGVGENGGKQAAKEDGDDKDKQKGAAKAKPKKKEKKEKGKAKAKARGRAKAAVEDDDDEEESEADEEEEEVESDEEEVDEDEDEELKKKGRRRQTHKGSNEGLRPWHVVQLVAVEAGAGKNGDSAAPSTIMVRRFYRPEEISVDLAYRSDYWDLYAPSKAAPAAGPAAKGGNGAYGSGAAAPLSITVGEVYGKCMAILGRPRPQNPKVDTFLVVGCYEPAAPGSTGPPPPSLDLPAQPQQAAGKDGRKAGGKAAAAAAAAAAKEAAVEEGAKEEEEETDAEAALYLLPSMDIFAGCGGLSEGMHQARVADTKWAIEYDSEAAEAFKLNNPAAKVFCNNCNVLLRAAMLKAGLESDCHSALECDEAVGRLDEATRADLPAPGSAALMMGGPPCQGYSGMNRFNRGNWSQVQNSMVMAYLSFCDFYRPRYFLLENVRNFVVYNGGRVFRLVLRTLLDLGYQVRFGILNAGNFGVPQSRKRTFIWAAQPGELLPDWPTPRHVFMSSQLGVRLGQLDAAWGAEGGAAEGAGASAGGKKGGDKVSVFFASGPPLPGAPLRTVTVRDAIWDLPAVGNDAKEDLMPYTGQPVSAFQRYVRGGAAAAAAAAGGSGAGGGESGLLRDHNVKPMNELNLERCRCIPKGVSGADWRVLQDIVRAHPEREFYKGDLDQPLVPWCLPNTADRHNQWRGLYGRLDPDGHFPTATTDPNPMGKVGQVLHPLQDRIVSVRECARSQGFPDHFRFHGNVHCRHRQVGNAVPPPLARALGEQLRRALKERRARDARDAEEQLQAMRARRQQQQR